MQLNLFPPSKDEKIIETLKKYGLPVALKGRIEEFLEDEQKESILICCHSDCIVCNEVIYQCLQEIKRIL